METLFLVKLLMYQSKLYRRNQVFFMYIVLLLVNLKNFIRGLGELYAANKFVCSFELFLCLPQNLFHLPKHLLLGVQLFYFLQSFLAEGLSFGPVLT